MNEQIASIAFAKAKEVIKLASTPYGFVATSDGGENYGRIWARDAMITGIASTSLGDDGFKETWKQSIITLYENRSVSGLIPSNFDPSTGKSSYGSLVGRVDANLWWLLGCGLYIQQYKDEELLQNVKKVVNKLTEILQHWEFNDRGLLYTPLSGNWADEYPYHGYLLYDNALRYWAMTTWARLLQDEDYSSKALQIKELIKTNFWPITEQTSEGYHPKLHQEAKDKNLKHWMSGFNPSQNYYFFDAAAIGIALNAGLFDDHDAEKLEEFIITNFQFDDKTLIPSFWPVLREGDKLYEDIKNNFSYVFKNFPHHFHNGGIWPVMMGWVVAGLRRAKKTILADKIFNDYLAICRDEDYQFHEYLSSDLLVPGGKKNMCFSASGLLLMMPIFNK
jgi:glycogen debranching enzyme